MSPRLFTVRIVPGRITRLGHGADTVLYEADFAGLHFARTDIRDVRKWVRVAARNRYGKNTQVIFITEREDQ